MRKPLTGAGPRIAAAVIGLALAGLGIRGILKRGTVPPPRATSTARSVPEAEELRRKLELADREALEGGGVAPQDRFGALVRMAQRQEPVAREKALQWVNDPDALVRQGVANALGQYDDGISLKNLITLTGDKDRSVRLQAIRALGHRPSVERVQRLEELAGAPAHSVQLDPELELLRQQSLFKAATGPRAEEIRQKALQALLRSGDRGAEAAASLAPRAPGVLEFLRKRATRSTEPGDAVGAANAIRHLTVVGDPWLSENLSALWKRQDTEVRRAVLQSLPSICPGGRWKLIREGLLVAKEAAVQSAALEALSAFPGEEARALLLEAGKSPELAPAARERLPAAKASVESASGRDPCVKTR